MCVLDTRQPVACVPQDSAQTDDEVCAVRARDGAIFLSPTGSLLGLGFGAWEPCDAGQAADAQEFCAP